MPSASEAAEALLEYGRERDDPVWASPYLYSAAIRACAADGDFDAGKRFFIEGRRAAGIATDNAGDVAAAAVAAAATAAESGTAPIAPARINAGVEAVYMATLVACAAAGDGSLARDVLRWMKMEGFQASEEAYMLAIDACCTPAAAQDPSIAQQSQAPFGTAQLSASESAFAIPPTSGQMINGAFNEAMPVAERPSLSEEERDGDRPAVVAGVSSKSVSFSSAAAAAAAAAATTSLAAAGTGTVDVAASGVPPPPPPTRDGGDAAGRGGAKRSAEAIDDSHTAGVETVGTAADVGEAAAGAEVGGVPSTTEGRTQQAPTTEERGSEKQSEEGEGEEKEKEQELEWFVIPGGRREPPELDADGNEKGVPPFAAGGAMSMNDAMGGAGAASFGDGAYEAGAAAAAAAGPGSSGGQEKDMPTPENSSRRKTSSGAPSSQPSSPAAPRVGAVTVLAPPAGTGSRAGQESGSVDLSAADKSVEVGRGGGNSSSSSSGSEAASSEFEDEGIEWQRARAILDDMAAAEHLPTPPAEAFQAVLSACDAAGRVGEALDVAQAMVVAGYAPSARLVARLMASNSDELDRERREAEEAAASPAGD
ncbi:unnamed protein product [Scytosiphon promiscuus]